MVYQRVRPCLSVLGMFTRGFVIAFPVVVTLAENVGSFKIVGGISMQVGLKTISWIYKADIVEFMLRSLI